jgi:hypothetical protein
LRHDLDLRHACRIVAGVAARSFHAIVTATVLTSMYSLCNLHVFRECDK